MYTTRPGLILGFHGCDKALVNAVLNQEKELKPSLNDYDWLGHGIYFWENSPARAIEYATAASRRRQSSIKEPAVIGAVIDLGYCLDLIEYENLQLLKEGYSLLVDTYNEAALPRNRDPRGSSSSDLLFRQLDCAVIQTLHKVREDYDFQPFDSVRGLFTEGNDIYPGAGFKEKSHTQLCIRNPNCIKGYFLPRQEDSKFHKV